MWKHKRTNNWMIIFWNWLLPVWLKKKQVLSDFNPGPLPSHAYSLPPAQACRRPIEIWNYYELSPNLPFMVNSNFDHSVNKVVYRKKILVPDCNTRLFFLPPPPTSHELQYISVTSAFTRLSMKTKYVWRCFISSYVNFHYNRTMWSTKLHVKICRWGEKEKEPNTLAYRKGK